MFRLIAAVLVTLLATVSFAADKSMTEEQKTLYAIGLIIFNDLVPFNLTPAELEYVKQGLTDAGNGNPELKMDAYAKKVQELAQARRKAVAEKQVAANKGYLDQAAKEKGAVKSGSGMIYIPLKEGNGAVPGPSDMVKVNYRGTFPDGKEFDSSYMRGQPAELRLDGVIRCWSEGLQKMKSGGKARLVCPPETAYGDSGAGDLILPGATLAFEVELLGVMK